MTIEKGEDWGSRGPLAIDAPIVSNDRALAELFSVVAGALSGPSQVGLAGAGAADSKAARDLARTVSARATEDELRSNDRTQLPIDLSIVTVDGVDYVMASSLVIRRPLWLGTVEGAMNASFLGDWNVTPSGHPNDGRLDVVHAELSIGDWWKARSRLSLGTHLPHPKIGVRRLRQHEFVPGRGTTVQIDGHNVGRATSVLVTVVPDATTVVI